MRQVIDGRPVNAAMVLPPVIASNAEIDAMLNEAVKAGLLPAGAIK